ncbi:hypothetical protein JRG19_02815 [Pseudoclavibacter alba]|uniref:LPXTG cell wall anchor domain-containing protein n=1 Tax=Pseudoclavibacter albus TaxID=272241 RepID=A0ABT2HXY4_9MICO|nr:hypothetical protein [Pseudoclavibacter alba]MBN6777482.1 hypothetical protein [Pseudoclavibacter alba]MCT2043175.1 hypothetical protein [Pseudoclavibacter alba]
MSNVRPRFASRLAALVAGGALAVALSPLAVTPVQAAELDAAGSDAEHEVSASVAGAKAPSEGILAAGFAILTVAGTTLVAQRSRAQ